MDYMLTLSISDVETVYVNMHQTIEYNNLTFPHKTRPICGNCNYKQLRESYNNNVWDVYKRQVYNDVTTMVKQ